MGDFIEKIARAATLSTEGVATFSSPIDVFVKKKKDKYEIDVFVIVKFGVVIPEIAWDIQENINNALIREGVIGIGHINIHVQGVNAQEDK